MSGPAHWAGVVMDSTDPQRLGRFWADVLGYVVVCPSVASTLVYGQMLTASPSIREGWLNKHLLIVRVCHR